MDKNETITIHGNRTETVDKNESITISQAQTVSILLAQTTAIGLAHTVTVGAVQAITVGMSQAITVGRGQTVTVGGGQTISVAKDVGEKIGGGFSQTVAKDHATAVTGGRSATVGKDDSLTVTKKLVIDAGEEILIKTGDAQLLMKKDGSIALKGKNIVIEGSGKITVKASSDLTLKGSKDRGELTPGAVMDHAYRVPYDRYRLEPAARSPVHRHHPTGSWRRWSGGSSGAGRAVVRLSISPTTHSAARSPPAPPPRSNPPAVGGEVVLLFENGDPARPIVLGVIRPPDASPGVTAEVDGERVLLSADAGDRPAVRRGKHYPDACREGADPRHVRPHPIVRCEPDQGCGGGDQLTMWQGARTAPRSRRRELGPGSGWGRGLAGRRPLYVPD